MEKLEEMWHFLSSTRYCPLTVREKLADLHGILFISYYSVPALWIFSRIYIKISLFTRIWKKWTTQGNKLQQVNEYKCCLANRIFKTLMWTWPWMSNNNVCFPAAKYRLLSVWQWQWGQLGNQRLVVAALLWG